MVKVKFLGTVDASVIACISKYDVVYFADDYDWYTDDTGSINFQHFEKGTEGYLADWYFCYPRTHLLELLNNIN